MCRSNDLVKKVSKEALIKVKIFLIKGEKMLKLPLLKPKPDFEYFIDVLSGKKKQDKVVFIELLIDEEIQKYIIENYFNEKYILPTNPRIFHKSEGKSEIISNNFKKDKEDRAKFLKQTINFWHRMGYDCWPELEFFWNFESLNTISIEANDTAALSKGKRSWGNEGTGMIASWEDFEKFPWDKAERMVEEYGDTLEFVHKKLMPEGMKIIAQSCMWVYVLVWILGYEGLFFKAYDEPDLVEAVFNKVGKLVYDQYKIACENEGVGVIWHGDDIGFKTSTLVSPELLRKWVFPWWKKYSDLAHEYKKPFWLHACGNKDLIIKDLIEDIRIDALHSFENVSNSVVDYKKRFGDKITILGGVDMDKLTTLNENDLRKYVRNILDICMQGGRYALGAGNSISNYVPINNYLIMLDEGLSWH